MPLPMPRLDNRTFDQLVAEGSALLPRLAPGWTDHNLHDPGITLIDLLAWLVEMDVYRLDRTSPAVYRAFLRLVGIEPRPPQVAETVLVFHSKNGSGPVHLPNGVQVGSQGGRIQFQTTRNLSLLPAQLIAVLSSSEDALVDGLEQNRNVTRRFAPFGTDPQPGQAFYLGFDKALAGAGVEVSLYVWVNSPERDAGRRQKLIEEYKVETAMMEACGRQVTPYQHGWQRHYSVRTQWEYYAGSNKWLPLADVVDESRGLTLSGAVRFVMPAAPPHAQGGVKTKPDLYFIRCRLVSGCYDCPPEIQHIALNAVPAHHAVDVEISECFLGNGQASQVFPLQHAPVAPGSTRLQVQWKGSPDGEWHEAPNWDRVGPHDRTYVLSPESAQITFGNGRAGRVLPAGAEIEATYQIGGGPDGNVLSGKLNQLLSGKHNEALVPSWKSIQPTLSVAQPFAATGGSDAETLADAKGRAVEWLNRPHRAVTLLDFEQMALATPGAPVARAHALPDYDPAMLCLPALGTITVVVVPDCANPIPEPGPHMLRAVELYLDRRRTLTTELHVIGPSFITVGVHATLHTGPEAGARSLIAEAESRLNEFLHPLRGGADGQGWPFGRDVYQAEVMALLNAIPGVTHVDDVGLKIESELNIYQGYVSWMQVFDRKESTTTVRTQLRIEPDRLASQWAAQARQQLESYFQSRPGQMQLKLHNTRDDVAMILRSVPGVIHLDEANVDDEQGSSALCGNVSLCPHSLVVPGKHHLTVSGSWTGKPIRATKPPC